MWLSRTQPISKTGRENLLDGWKQPLCSSKSTLTPQFQSCRDQCCVTGREAWKAWLFHFTVKTNTSFTVTSCWSHRFSASVGPIFCFKLSTNFMIFFFCYCFWKRSWFVFCIYWMAWRQLKIDKRRWGWSVLVHLSLIFLIYFSISPLSLCFSLLTLLNMCSLWLQDDDEPVHLASLPLSLHSSSIPSIVF